MQRFFIPRNIARCTVGAALCSEASLRIGNGVKCISAPPRASLLPQTQFRESMRFYSGGHEEEPPTRSGQYLLDKNDVLTRVLEVVKNFEKVDAAKVTPESHFVNDLGLNSLDVVEVVFAIEQEFILDIPDHDAEKLQSIPDTVEYIAQNPMAK
eukprot:gene415-221_t